MASSSIFHTKDREAEELAGSLPMKINTEKWRVFTRKITNVRGDFQHCTTLADMRTRAVDVFNLVCQAACYIAGIEHTRVCICSRQDAELAKLAASVYAAVVVSAEVSGCADVSRVQKALTEFRTAYSCRA